MTILLLSACTGTLLVDDPAPASDRTAPTPEVPPVEPPTDTLCQPPGEPVALHPTWSVSFEEYAVQRHSLAVDGDLAWVIHDTFAPRLENYEDGLLQVSRPLSLWDATLHRDQVLGVQSANANGGDAVWIVTPSDNSPVPGLNHLLDQVWGIRLLMNDTWIVAHTSEEVHVEDRRTGTTLTIPAPIHGGSYDYDDLVLAGDDLWELVGDASLRRFDLLSGEVTEQLLTVPDVEQGAGAFGLHIGPEGPSYVSIDGVRHQLGFDGVERSTRPVGWRLVNENRYATWWNASPIAWSEEHVAYLAPRGQVVIEQRCDEAQSAFLVPLGIYPEPIFSDAPAAITELAWSEDGQRLFVRVEGGLAAYDL